MARVAIIVEEGFEDADLRVPYERLRRAGHEVVVVGREVGKTLTGKGRAAEITTARSIREAAARDFDALVIPGGHSPDELRTDPLMVEFTRQMFDAGKPVAANGHAGALLIEAEVVEDRTLTSWPSIRTDLVNAGARWVDEPLVEDGSLITARRPEDLEAFCDAVLRQLEGRIPERIHAPRPPDAEDADEVCDGDPLEPPIH
ncbi:MAG TPA: type 1 glutamine amidotransferase domain-containing protein [Polyangia bacterium]|nr:type 1 glutamine amidotransferase domain-containing protein [Polyangia bacterium]